MRGDTGFIADTGAEILVETARMWADLGFYGEDGGFHIHGVTGPDEYTTMVDDNAYTNLMARLNLHYAASTMRRLAAEQPDVYASIAQDLQLRPGELDEWDRVADHMHIPHDRIRGITPRTPRSSPTNDGISRARRPSDSRSSSTRTHSRSIVVRC